MNLNMKKTEFILHYPFAFYESFDSEEARKSPECFEFIYTPKHGS